MNSWTNKRASAAVAAYNLTMFRHYAAIVLEVFLALSWISGCSAPNYNSDTTQACANGHIDPGESDVDCGGSCAPCANGKACRIDSDCSHDTCINNRCYDPTCRDRQRDNAETDIDCGGPICPPCKAGSSCIVTGDCVTGQSCLGNVCFNAACQDGKQDGTETDVDCGGDQCPVCPAGKACKLSTDCSAGNLCIVNVCYESSCQDGTQNGTETDIDCGGTSCPACSLGEKCLQNSDCGVGNFCIGGTCYIGSCEDNKLDNFETDVDCGGTQCPPCDKGKICNKPSDCIDSVPCTNGRCGDPQCFDGKQNGTETDVDCGGSCGACAINKNCNIAADCQSLNCQSGTCAAPSCHDGSQNEGESDIDCGDAVGICPRCGTGKTCTDSSSCASNHCITGVCAPPSCSDSILNGTETAIDCGGTCDPCADSLTCLAPTDCVSGVCQGGTCQSPTCSDGVRNGKETGKDCGGPCVSLTPAQLCPNGEGCSANSDCIFNTCTAGVCQPPTCSNGVLDPGETDVDCGGNCSPCGDGLKCATGQDCQSKVCDSSSKTCSKATCSDMVQNGNETDVDCGGTTCTQRCLTGKNCLSDSDCQSKVCDSTTNRCLAPTCNDGVQNGTETGQDCGGSCALMSPARTCDTGSSCGVNGDCTSNDCCTASTCPKLNVCSAPSCTDGKKNEGESGIDCGGTSNCGPCGPGQSCQLSSDCGSSVCTTQLCQPPSCSDNVKNGTEMGIDCGGNCPKGCPAGTTCNGPGDCDSGVCSKTSAACDSGVCPTSSVCAAPSCSDGVKNGLETYVDCGGGCKGCAQGQPCNLRTDCDLTLPNTDCIGKVCAVPQCNDGTLDGSETDVDCGGTCKQCANGKHCLVAADCTSAHCAPDTTGALSCAAPTCSDGIQNQGESGIDCGGSSTCAKCGTGFGCTVPSDCTSGVCGASNTCLAPTCKDGVQNQQETDVDCGGPNCSTPTTACANGKICKVNSDCLESWCVIAGTTGTCTHPTCSDSVQNGTESDVDCGGSCPAKCANAKKCNQNSDCANGWCNASGLCATPSCSDGIMNGSETGKDCGGSCALSCSSGFGSSCQQCATGSGCVTNLDCLSLNCSTSKVCAAATNCIAKELNGQGPTGCALCSISNPSEVQLCKSYLLCYFLNSCNPITGLDVHGNDCTGNAAVCGQNTFGGGSATISAATATYTCACP